MTSQHTPPADHAQASSDERSPSAGHQPRDAQTMSDEEAIRLMRHWAEEAQADPARHSYFPSLVRTLVTFLKSEANRDALREAAAAASTPRPKSYEIPPVGIPDVNEVTLDTDDAYRVFSTLLDAIKAWDYSTDPLADYAARVYLGDLLDAVKIMNAGYMAAIEPGVQAHRDDEAAARAWTHDRWMTRGELACAARAHQEAQERQRGDRDTQDDPAAASAPPPSAASREALGA